MICVGRMTGTHKGTLLGVAATGRTVEWRQCHLYRFDATGRAVEHDAIRDDVEPAAPVRRDLACTEPAREPPLCLHTALADSDAWGLR